jgi:hypothetical protein
VTQAGDMDDAEEGEQLEALARETFVIAWPPREPDAPLLGDVFEGL